MAITLQQVEKVSLLARLLLSPQELRRMTSQMGQILDYMDLLAEVDTEHADTGQVEPMAHALEVSDVFAEDTVCQSLPREEALANAPNRDEECYRVPAVLGDL